MPRINEYPETQSLSNDDKFLIDPGDGGYKSIKASDLAYNVQASALGPIYNAESAQNVSGVPASIALSDLVSGIGDIATAKYNEGETAGYASGRSQGREDVGNNLSYQGGFGQAASGSHNYTVDKDHYILLCVITVSRSNPPGVVREVTGAEFISSVTFDNFMSASSVGGTREFRLYKTTGTTVTVQKTGMPGDVVIIELGPCT